MDFPSKPKPSGWGSTLEDYIRELCCRGLKVTAPEFEHLISAYGREHILELRLKVLAEELAKESSDGQ